MAPDEHLVGRGAVLDRVRSALDPAGQVAAVLLTGPAGIGKSTVLEACARAVQGTTVVRLRPSAAESSLPYAGLADMLDTIPSSALREVPGPQREALEVAVLRRAAPEAGQDLLAVHLAVLALLRRAVQQGPLLLIVDDLPWLDAETTAALSFAARRPGPARWMTLAAARTGDGHVLTGTALRVLPTPVEEVVVGPLDASAVDRLVRRYLKSGNSAALRAALVDASDGNPYLAGELARAFVRARQPWNPITGLPVPVELAELLRARLRAVPEQAWPVLVAAATSPRPEIGAVLAATNAGPEALAAAGTVVDVVNGVLRFEHPLLAQVLRQDAGTAQVREAHARWSRVLDDPVRRAWHRALATTGPDATVAQALEEAAKTARERAALHTSAELWRLAAERTPPAEDGGAARRLVAAAEAFADAGELDAAEDAAVFALEQQATGALRARALAVRSEVGGQDVRSRAFLEQAVEQAREDPALRAAILTELAICSVVEGDRVRAAELFEEAVTAARCSPGTPLVFALSLSADNSLILGRNATSLIAEAIDLERQYEPHPHYNTLMLRALVSILADDVDHAVLLLEQARAYADDSGQPAAMAHARARLVEGLLAAGRCEEALDLARSTVRLAEASGAPDGGPATAFLARAAAAAGDVETATLALAAAEPRASQDRDTVMGGYCLLVRAQLSLALDTPDAADRYRAVRDHVQVRQHREPTRLNWHADAAEAFVRGGHLDEAAAVLDELQEQAFALGRRSQSAAWARSRALLLAASGLPDDALVALDDAERHLSGLRAPIHLGRVELVRGQVLRRLRRRAAAREAMRRAADLLVEAPLWRRRAEQLLADLQDGRGGGALTPAEHRVATLVAQGCTNREVAQSLFMSVKTVEAHLSHTYRKLGVRSRSELVRHLIA